MSLSLDILSSLDIPSFLSSSSSPSLFFPIPRLVIRPILFYYLSPYPTNHSVTFHSSAINKGAKALDDWMNDD
jgi:hypothetical protein